MKCKKQVKSYKEKKKSIYVIIARECYQMVTKRLRFTLKQRVHNKVHRSRHPAQVFLLIPPFRPSLSRNPALAQIQWNPDFSNTRLFEPPDSSNQKSFPLDLLQSNTVILHPIFRMLDFSKLPIFGTNPFFLSKIYIRFLEL